MHPQPLIAVTDVEASSRWDQRLLGARAETFGGHLMRAFVLPYSGCVLFLSLWSAGMWMRTLLYGGLANLHDTLSLYAMGLTVALASFFVVVPYGLLCLYVLQSTLRLDVRGDRRRAAKAGDPCR